MVLRRLGAAVLAAVLLAACGTTVPLAQQQAVQGPGSLGGPLGEPTASSTAPGASSGGPVPGGLGTSPGTGPTTAPGQEPSGAPSGVPGGSASADRSPVKVGVTYINNDATSSALGVDDPSSVTKKSIVRALVRGLNLRGGFNGRRIIAVEYEWNSQSNNWSQDAATACARFTQDVKVAVVIDNAFGTIGNFRECLERAGVFVMQSGPEGDAVSSRDARLHANPTSTTIDRSYAAVLRGLKGTGYLTSKNKIGVLIEGCTDVLRAWQRVLKPLIAQLGLVLAQEATAGCATGFASAGPAASSVSNAVLRFRGAGVDRVMFLSDNESVLLLLWAQTADSQDYRAGYLLSSNAQAQALRTQVPAGQHPLFHGVGQRPFGDVDGAAPGPAGRRCLDLVKAAGLGVASSVDRGTVLFECGPFLLAEAALARSGGRATGDALAAATASLGTSFASPGGVREATSFSSTQHDGPSLAQVFGYVASCDCLRHSGAPFAV